MIFTENDIPIIGHIDYIDGLGRCVLIKLFSILVNMQYDLIRASFDNPKQDKCITEGRRNTEDLLKRICKIYLPLLFQYHLMSEMKWHPLVILAIYEIMYYWLIWLKLA